MQDSECKAPADGAPQGAGEGGDSTSESAPQVVETSQATPQTTATSRSLYDEQKKATANPGTYRRLPSLGRAALAIAGGVALFGAALVQWAVRGSATSALPLVSAAPLAATLAESQGLADGGALAATPDGASDSPPARAPVWRVASLVEDPSVSLLNVTIDRRPLLAALAAVRVSRAEGARLARSLAAVRDVDRLGAKDVLTVALDKATSRVVAYELTTSPRDVWQGREQAQADGSKTLQARKLDLLTQLVRMGKAVRVGADLRASLLEAGLGPVDEMMSMLDDALDGHTELSDIRPGARLRIVGTQEQVEGAFARWVSLDAVEYFPASPGAPSVRVYSLSEGNGEPRAVGWYDAKGRQPFHGGWRTPVPLARIASRFNPHRMHPVLHVVMPHNGVDLAAPIGAPVYATAAGVVAFVGNDGPCGNKVEIEHAGGLTSVYCHLSRFAQGVHVGLHVEQRQLIAYVGQTGRVTGPHLHFGIRRGGMFIDPMTLRLDGVRVVPHAVRDDFDRRRAELDAQLDDIPLPAAGAAPVDTSEPETFYEEP